MSATAGHSSSILGLPPEIRQQIYYYVIWDHVQCMPVTEFILPAKGKSHILPRITSLHQVSPPFFQAHPLYKAEGLQLIYSKFYFHFTSLEIIKPIPKHIRHFVKHIGLTVDLTQNRATLLSYRNDTALSRAWIVTLQEATKTIIRLLPRLESLDLFLKTHKAFFRPSVNAISQRLSEALVHIGSLPLTRINLQTRSLWGWFSPGDVDVPQLLDESLGPNFEVGIVKEKKLRPVAKVETIRLPEGLPRLAPRPRNDEEHS